MAITELRFCIDCLHYRRTISGGFPEVRHRCDRPGRPHNMVEGFRPSLDAVDERRRGEEVHCGPNGQFFTPRRSPTE